MTKYIGRKINVGFGIEAARGTAVAIQNRQPKTDMSYEETNEVIQDESSIGVITDSRDSFVVKRWAEGEISGNIECNSIGYLLYSLLGDVTSTVDSTGAWEHVFTLAETNQSPSLTVGLDDPVIGQRQYALAMIESMTISAEEGQQATFSINIKSRAGTSATHTVAYNADHKLLSRHSIFKIANNLAGLDGASEICLKSFEITFTKNLFDDFCLGSISPIDFLNQQFTIEGSFTALFTSQEFRNIQLDGVHKAVRFTLLDTANTIGISSNPELNIDLPLANFTEFSRSQGNDEVVTQTLNFKGIYSVADDSSIEIALVNTIEEYDAQS